MPVLADLRPYIQIRILTVSSGAALLNRLRSESILKDFAFSLAACMPAAPRTAAVTVTGGDPR